jgi:hypothetical protein
MAKTRLILLGALAALAISAVATATASAHEFLVEGAKVTTPVTGTFTSGTSTLTATIKSKKIQIVAKLDTGTFILQSGGASRFTVSFTNITVYEEEASGHLKNTGCIAQSVGGKAGLITFSGTDQLLTTENSNKEFLDTFKGNGAEEGFVTFLLAECAVEGSYTAKGTMNARVPEPTVNKPLHNLVFEPADESLSFGTEPLSFTSTESLILTSLKSWSGV